MSSCPITGSKIKNTDDQSKSNGNGCPFSTPKPSTTDTSKNNTTDTSKNNTSKEEESINPLNNIPNNLTNKTSNLANTRTLSTIKNTASTLWEYPSPLQFYNALLRKGKGVDEAEVSGMVEIHNFLNEGSWREIERLERLYHPECLSLSLSSFKGRPNDLSPKAWFHTTILGNVRPFDRHDWVVDRCGVKQRYVIDYYSGSVDEEFYCDVRVACDSIAGVWDWVREVGGSFFK